MELIVFDHDDEPYLKWMSDNPNGYVVNTDRAIVSQYFTLHQSGCHYITGDRNGGFTSRQYIKVCSNNHQEILEWASKNRLKVTGFDVICKSCKPYVPILSYSPEEMENALAKMPSIIPPPKGQKIPAKVSSSSTFFARDVRVVKYVLQEAAGICEACNTPSPFSKPNGVPYLEVHHLRHLAEHGSDTIENTIAVCPNCHRMLHYGINKNDAKSLIYSQISRLIEE